MEKLYPPVISAIMENLAEGDTVAVAVNKGFKSASYETELSDLTVGNTINASGVGLGEQLALNMNLAPDYFLFTAFSNGVTLSDTIHSGEAQAAVKKVLNDYFKFKGNAQELSKKLRNINRYPNTDIPKSLSELVRLARGLGDTKNARVYQRQLNKAYKTVSKLDARGVVQTADLKKAYTGLIRAVESGDLLKVDKALDYAFGKKVNYINDRVARTEFAQAYEMSFQRQMQEGGYKYEQFTLSSSHPKVDQCDFCADADLYGLGAGVAPVGKGFSIPVHPQCLCTKVPLYEPEKDGSGRYSQKRANEYLDGLSERDRKNIVGAKYSDNGNYTRGLEKKGIKPNPKTRMISKTVLTKAE